MFESKYVILELINYTGEIPGRKKLQKIFHLLKLHKNAVPFKYEYHHYGPYSFQLQAETNSLVSDRYLIETYIGETYKYNISESGEEFKTALEDELGLEAKLDSALIDKLMDKSAQFLELVSTYGYFLDMGYSVEEAKAKCLELKSHLSSNLDEAIQFYHEYI